MFARSGGLRPQETRVFSVLRRFRLTIVAP